MHTYSNPTIYECLRHDTKPVINRCIISNLQPFPTELVIMEVTIKAVISEVFENQKENTHDCNLQAYKLGRHLQIFEKA